MFDFNSLMPTFSRKEKGVFEFLKATNKTIGCPMNKTIRYLRIPQISRCEITKLSLSKRE